ncbi:hypothetical protein NMY22_g12516 [Coprinellus aureogranulatus]|nr:hypothetical protein NMY22_g12516 [Coprinellus aureogranulatus]
MQRDSERFPPADADVVFVSSDGVRYGIQSRNLELATGGFPAVDAKITGESEPVPLTEPSSVLDLLFAFVYPAQLPLIEDMDFGTIMGLAEAAEKYQVYSAIYACRMCLRHRGDLLRDHPIEIALLAAKHDYEDILKLTSEHAVKVPLSQILPVLPQRLVIPWLQSETDCKAWHKVSNALCSKYAAQALYTSSEAETLLQVPFQMNECCDDAVKAIRSVLEKKFHELKPFAQFVRENY